MPLNRTKFMAYEMKVRDLLKKNTVAIGNETFELINIAEDSGSQGEHYIFNNFLSNLCNSFQIPIKFH